MNNWNEFIESESKKDYFVKLNNYLNEQRLRKTIYPKEEEIFKAFDLCPMDKLLVVFLGQDPYHEENQANGLAFSVNKNVPLPNSLQNIYKELHNDLNINIPKNGDLTKVAMQGVLFLNTILTVEKGHALSHKDIGWEIFSDNVLKEINKMSRPICFILLGNNAISKTKMITNPIHLIITSSHPSPLSSYRGFMGSRIFSKCNEFLLKNYNKQIDWNVLNE